MPAVTIAPADLEPFATIEQAKAEAMIADAVAMAKLVAPCIATDDFEHPDAAKAVIRGAILRWNEAGQGGVQSLGAGMFNQTLDNRQPRRAMFWPSEIEQLQKMCAGSGDGAWSYDMLASSGSLHADVCSLNLGAQYCSCGADLTGGSPLWEE
ncbi:hypothetical protein FZI85_17250 [Mycobacterium sp. CBMA293]|uniref:hypothetical protein n=1 Tax=unclassified Mycolicibacterium TaxID=2636767 RepID=UPI0012DC1E18|nr:MULTISPECIES: hypothetical protein [unclassified Mycolicibacterium]MUL44471.1 hypothetical protein [Mycolicibacterium sp. CBMA 360]MUL59791.1 hypothetical protein [Mycolicibacterium sp. CBMA 335]MUL68634.1 hypothetical protein [Mycolicibacterium sp. CBMA 311]MUL93975.1 hypothetical protein [Mycolicibacterium sp. CBMA 230]MUM06222.1 hypothetical protein [Mycolicibacterium sp. CBMA 213]